MLVVKFLDLVIISIERLLFCLEILKNKERATMPAKNEPVKIGLFVGREWSFPPAFIEEVNNRTDKTGVIAEYMKVGGTMMNEAVEYKVIIDRISHEVPYYRSFLKNAALQGVRVVNDPFMWTSDDKFFGASLITELGLHSPRTVVLPNKEYVPGIVHSESLRNLTYPMDWRRLVDYVNGFPCVLKDAHGGGWRDVYVVNSMEELMLRYNQSGLLTMIVQEFIEWDEYARCMGLAQQEVHVMRYDPKRRFYHPEHGFDAKMHKILHDATLKICQTFGYDMNTCEFAVKDGIPYAIDFMNPAPDMDVNSLGKGHFDWIVQHMADNMIDLALNGAPTKARYAWGGTPAAANKATPKATSAGTSAKDPKTRVATKKNPE
jgi:glutathione synthase/RimK-type ligase-like ATP-grasp enzyme